MSKKKFSETKFGKFLGKAKGILPEVADAAIKVATGNLSGAIQSMSDSLQKKSFEKPNDQTLKRLHLEFEEKRNEFELEMYKLEVEDRDSARTREVEMAKTGRSDWLMPVTGLVALFTFLLMVLTVIFDHKLQLGIAENSLFHQLMGIIEGVSLTIFAYYFGTSKSSNDKNKLLSQK